MEKHKAEIKINHSFNKLHIGGSTEASDLIDSGRDDAAVTLSRRYWEHKVLDYEEKVIDGFYDVTSISSQVQGKMSLPSLTDLEPECAGSYFEAVIVNRSVDSALEKLVQVAQHNAKDTQVRILVERLADLVAGHMGGPVESTNTMLEKWMERRTELRTSRRTILLPIGDLNIGLSRHRALLFKVLADNVKLPCRLVKSSHYTGVEADAVNIIKLDNEREYLVDLMAVPGTLTPADMLTVKDSSFKSHNPDISRTPSLDSSIDVSVVYTRSQPLPGNGNCQISAKDSFSCSVNAESSFSLSGTNANTGAGSSGSGTSPHKASQGNLAAGDSAQMNSNIAPNSQNSPEDSKNLVSDPNPVQIIGTSKDFMANKPAGNSSTDELQGQKESTVPGRPPLPPQKNRNDNTEVPTRKEGSEGTRKLGNSSKSVTEEQENEGLQLRDQRDLTIERCVGSTSKMKEPESTHFSEDSRRSRDGNILDDVGEYEIPWEDLKIGERIGIGLHGEVYRALWNDQEVAVKKFTNADFSRDALEKFKREVHVLQTLRHPNIVTFIGAVTRPPNHSIVTELLQSENLYHILHRSQHHIDEKRRIKMALDVARGMNCLHTNEPTIVHRDLKSPNLLVDEHWNVKICDFGMSRLKHQTFISPKTSIGTTAWAAPEILSSEPSNEKCDVYSFGVILWELATLRSPCSGMDLFQIVGTVGFRNQRLEIPEEVDPAVAKIISQCWQTEPNLRPSFAQLIEALEPLQRLTIPPQEYVSRESCKCF